jgi:hypothetical protein
MSDIAVVDKPKRKRPKWVPKPRPFDRSQLDGRTVGAKIFDKMVSDITAELGGSDQIGTIEMGLVEGYVGMRLGVKGFNARLVSGEEIDWSQFCGTLSTMIRAAERLQPWRRSKDVTTFGDLIRQDQEQQRQRLAHEQEARQRGNVVDAEPVE